MLKIQVGLIRNWIGKERNTSVRASLVLLCFEKKLLLLCCENKQGLVIYICKSALNIKTSAMMFGKTFCTSAVIVYNYQKGITKNIIYLC